LRVLIQKHYRAATRENSTNREVPKWERLIGRTDRGVLWGEFRRTEERVNIDVRFAEGLDVFLETFLRKCGTLRESRKSN